LKVGRGAFFVFSVTALGCSDHEVIRLLPDPSSGGAFTSGGTASGGTDGTGLSPSTGGTSTDLKPLIIDDFGDCDDQILTTAGRSGSWYYFAEPAVYLVNVIYTVGVAPDDSWGTQSCGIYLTGGCPSCTASGVGLQLSNTPYDLSPHTGIRVSFESETSLWAVVVTKLDTASGYSEYVELTATGNMSGIRELPFASLGAGTGFQGIENAREIQFTVGEADRGSFGFGIHRVELY
jgi:hypothetical protein